MTEGGVRIWGLSAILTGDGERQRGTFGRTCAGIKGIKGTYGKINDFLEG